MIWHKEDNIIPILFQARSGSSYLLSALESHPLLNCYTEGWSIDRMDRSKTLFPPDIDNACVKIPIDLMRDYVRNEIQYRKSIVVYRSDRFAQFVSHQLAIANGYFMCPYTKTVKIDIKRCLRSMKNQHAKFLYVVESLRGPILILEYNEIVYGDGCQRALDFIGAPHYKLHSSVWKQSTKPLIEYVENKQEVLAKLGHVIR